MQMTCACRRCVDDVHVTPGVVLGIFAGDSIGCGIPAGDFGILGLFAGDSAFTGISFKNCGDFSAFRLLTGFFLGLFPWTFYLGLLGWRKCFDWCFAPHFPCVTFLTEVASFGVTVFLPLQARVTGDGIDSFT